MRTGSLVLIITMLINFCSFGQLVGYRFNSSAHTYSGLRISPKSLYVHESDAECQVEQFGKRLGVIFSGFPLALRSCQNKKKVGIRISGDKLRVGDQWLGRSQHGTVRLMIRL
jgi:hypothetical protein